MTEIENLHVIAHNTSMHIQSSGQEPTAAGQELGVVAVLCGRLRLLGDQLTVRVELLDVPSGAQIWSDRLQRPFGNVFDLQ